MMGLRLFNTLFLTAVLVGIKTAALGIPGGLSKEKPVTPEVQAIIDVVRPQVEELLRFPVYQFKGLSYKTQLVAGLNYFVKVAIGENEVVHVKMHEALDGNISLDGIQYPKGRDDPIINF